MSYSRTPRPARVYINSRLTLGRGGISHYTRSANAENATVLAKVLANTAARDRKAVQRIPIDPVSQAAAKGWIVTPTS